MLASAHAVDDRRADEPPKDVDEIDVQDGEFDFFDGTLISNDQKRSYSQVRFYKADVDKLARRRSRGRSFAASWDEIEDLLRLKVKEDR